jgi:CheY-like chemotaxis protein
MAASLVRRADLDPAAMLAPDDYVCLSFADTGKGMDEETLARAFEPFFTTKGPQRGTGLGLPTVQGILRQAGGDVTVKSTLGEGTTFRLYLPWVVDAEIELDSDTKELALPPGRETILLAEDEAMVRAFTSRVLRRAGYEVIEADDGGAALQAARAYAGHIALLITDVVMPELDGPALARRFAELRPGIPVVFLSGYAHEDGALEYLQKPFTPQELCRLVRARLDAENGLRPRA